MGDRLIAEYDYVGSRLLYYTPDQINSTRVVTDQAGTVVYSAAHDPYGGIQQTWVSTYDPQLKFSGKERDAESQLDYFGARYYDRSQYRFISVDPIISRQIVWYDTQAWNLYSICFNNPLSFVDRTGEYGGRTHHLMTVYTGLMVGMPLKLALMIAEANVAVDTNRATSSENPFHIVSGAMMKWHFPTEARYSQVMRVARTTLDPIIFGQCLHVIQDSFSHEGYSEWGHLGDKVLSWFGIKDDCDDPETDWGKTEDATLLTEWLMKKFWQRYLNAVIAAITAILSVLTWGSSS
jgi:RHS repeat-associated protein